MKEIDLSYSVYDLVEKYPELKDIMLQLGFSSIIKPGMLQTAGRYMTILKGAQMKKIPLEKVIAVLEEHHFKVKK